MAHTAKHNATIAKKAAAAKKKTAQKKIDNLKKAMGGKVDTSKLGKKQLKSWNKSIADRKSESNTIRTANIAISNAKKAENIVKRYEDDPAEQMRRLQIERNKQMEERGKQLIDTSLKGKQFEKGGAFDYGLSAQAYGDEMRAITGRQMGEGTAYTGPGAQVGIDKDGNLITTEEDIGGVPAGSIVYNIDTSSYAKRFRPKFQPTPEQLDKFGGPGAWAQGLLSGGDDYTYLTPWQQVNFQWMLEDVDKGLLGTAEADTVANLPSQWRTDWRKEEGGDTFNETTGRWEQATDPSVRQAAVEDQLSRYNAGLFNPNTGQPPESTGPEPWPGVYWPRRTDWIR